MVRARISGIRYGIARRRLVGALGGPYGGGLYSFLEREARFLLEKGEIPRAHGLRQRNNAFGFALGRSIESITIGRSVASSSFSSSSSSESSATARQNAFMRASFHDSPARSCIGADNTPVTFKVVSSGMLRCWAGIHGSQADESESLFDRGSRRRQDLTHPTIRPRQF